jgi:lipopolysaccharide/colanic/teichoic acid biosynthesis glycosyltransferase
MPSRLARHARPTTAEHPVPYPLAKRLTDRLVPLALLLLLSPLLLVVLAGVVLDMLLVPADRGAWLYRERRISGGREIGLLKFRVLRADVLARMREEGNEHVRLYEADVGNLTWAGRNLIKRWYLDEIPQLANILRGEMSLVGPRPWPPEMVDDQLDRGLGYRNLMLAGWTGPAQIHKESIESLRAAETLDLEYVDACRTMGGLELWRYDLRIVYRTVKMLLQGQGLRY